MDTDKSFGGLAPELLTEEPYRVLSGKYFPATGMRKQK